MNEKTETTNFSKRFCVYCNKINPFDYNKVIGHSECRECGSRFGKYVEIIKQDIMPKKKFKEHLASLEEVIKTLKEKNGLLLQENIRLKQGLKSYYKKIDAIALELIKAKKEDNAPKIT